MELREQEHNYELVATEDGFEIIPIEKHREPVRARLLQNGFWTIESSHISKDSAQWIFSEYSKEKNVIYAKKPGDFISKEFFPLFSFSPLLHKMVVILYLTWDKINGVVESQKKYTEFINSTEDNFSETDAGSSLIKHEIIHKWAIKQTVKTLSKKASLIAKEKHSILDPDVVKLHRLMYSESGGAGHWGNLYDILKDKEEAKYLVKDLINFRAARCLLLTTCYIGKEWDNAWHHTFDWKNFQWKEEIGDTKNFFVRKTISNYPNGVTYYDIKNFSRINTEYLSEPITSRIRMLAYIGLTESHAGNSKNYYKVIKNSTDEEIKKAIKMYCAEEGEKCDLRKTHSIEWAIHYMFDYAQKSDNVANINMIGLYKKAKKYHDELERERRQRDIERQAKRAKDTEEFLKKEAMLPPIALPENKHLTFLKTVKDIQEEGDKMHHCVSGYANYAVEGNSFLFHIDYNGESATAEVNRYGTVLQVRGPHNKENSATKYGNKILREWGKKFKLEPPKNCVDFKPEPVNEMVLEYAYDEDIPF